MKRVKYLNNRDLLAQIHASKNTYCSYVAPEDSQYDIIVPNLKKINPSAIAKARKAKAKRLTQRAWEEAKASGDKKIKLTNCTVSPRKIDKTDLVFRVNTYDHIPMDSGRKKNPKQTSDHHAKVNFPPFQHYRLDKKGKLKCVGKSHWIGGMSNGYFSVDHGKITNSLAMMFMKLCERYGTRANWRGYTYNDEMQSQALMQLSQIGLQFDESKSENPFAYYTAAITNSFTRILNIEKKNQSIRDKLHKFLLEKKIFCKIYFSPIHLTKFYQNKIDTNYSLPNTEEISNLVLTLPLFPNMTLEEKDYLINSIDEFFEKEK